MSTIEESNQESSIIRVVSYHRRDFDLSVIRFPSEERAPIYRSIAQPFPTAPISTFGGLERLPTELITAICLYLDILSCFHLRQVNRLARNIVSRVREYEVITSYALDALRAVLRTKVATHWTLTELYRPLRTTECTVCGNFGGFIFLPTANRCCFSCLGSAPALRTTSLLALSERYRITVDRLRHLVPVVKTIPGTYNLREKQWSQRTDMVAVVDAVETLKSLGIWPGVSDSTLDLGWDSTVYGYPMMVSTVLPYLNQATGKVERGVSCKGCEKEVETSYELEVYRRRDRDRVYSRQALLDHFQSCTEAQDIWTASRGGTVAVQNSLFVLRGGVASHVRVEL